MAAAKLLSRFTLGRFTRNTLQLNWQQSIQQLRPELLSINVINCPIVSASSVQRFTFRQFSSSHQTEVDTATASLDTVTYERVCAETLDGLSDYFEELTENANLIGSDVAYGDGVLTVKLGDPFGTYVINRQTPNKQIWLSSPTTGPKRFDFVGTSNGTTGKWIYKHSGQTLHQLLQSEISEIIKQQPVDFLKLPFCN